MRIVHLLVCVPLLLPACGEKTGPDLNVTFSAAEANAAWSDPTVVDLVIGATGIGLDTNGDGINDNFVFPDRCRTSPVSGCGYTRSDRGVTQTLGGLPLGYSYQITASFRDAGLAAVYGGTTTFSNTNPPPAVTIVVAKVTAP